MKQFLALYVGSPTPDASAAAQALGEETIAEGMAAWGAWMHKHAASIVDAGGPLGVTKRVSAEGIVDTHNAVGGYVVVEAESHEAAARMFKGHPHFAIFPGDAVEIMERLPIPGS